MTDSTHPPTQSATIGELAKALAQAQGRFTGAKKDTANPFFKTKYADLESVWSACRAQLAEAGLSVTQTTHLRDGAFVLDTILMHASGEWIKGTYPIVPTKQDPQSVGSAHQYARRYSLQAIVGVASPDDDEEGAMERPSAANPGKPPVRTAIDYSAENAVWVGRMDEAKDMAALMAIGEDLKNAPAAVKSSVAVRAAYARNKADLMNPEPGAAG